MSRPQKYSDEELKEILLKYATTNQGAKINFSQLEKATGIKRHIWSRRMEETIAQLNKPTPINSNVNTNKLPLINIEEVVETHWNNKLNLIKALMHYNETLHHLYEQAISYRDEVAQKEKLLEEINLQRERIKSLVKERDFYKKLYMQFTVKSSYKHFQTEEGIKNVISLEKNKERNLSLDLVKNFPVLFEDDEK